MFGPFCLLVGQRLLLEGEHPVALGSRALEILIALVERPGEVVTKDELVARVWPNTFVDESNLRVHIASLRKALGDGQGDIRYLATDPGRGYRFVAPITQADRAEAPAPPAHVAEELPASLVRMIGRAEVVAQLEAQLPERRFVTIVGPGGIGKTTVAIAVANRLAAGYPDGIAFLDLAPLTDPALVAGRLATLLGVAVRSGDPLPSVLAFLAPRQMLLVLDTCEHVVDAVAQIAEAIFAAAPQVHILATSREPLRASGERVTRLPSLDVPENTAALTAAEALRFPAVQLFTERASAANDRFELTDATASVVVEICRRLDGIALAIELAAGRVDSFDVHQLATLLEDRFRLIVQGRRTALPRHHTLGAALDWSYGTLDPDEQAMLRRLSVFAGNFDLEAATAVAGSDADAADVLNGIANLVAKSLIAADFTGGGASYRLLDTTRAYAAEKLNDSGGFAEVARRHAEYYRGMIEYAEANWETRSRAEWLADFRRHLDNLRVALGWAFSPAGDPTTALPLTAASVLVWTHLSLVDEGLGWVGRALALPSSGSPEDLRFEMRLRTGVGLLLMDTHGPTAETYTTWKRALDIAEQLDDTEYRLRASFGLWVYHFNVGEVETGYELARRSRDDFDTITDQAARLVLREQLGFSLYARGDLNTARHELESMLGGYQDGFQRRDDGRLVHDQRSSTRNFLARILWLQGFPERAMAVLEANLAAPGTHENAVSIANALTHGLPIPLWIGDLETAARLTGMLRDVAHRHGLGPWQLWLRGFEAMLDIERGDLEDGIARLSAVMEPIGELAFTVYRLAFLAALAEAQGLAGRHAEGLSVIDDALRSAKSTGELWCEAELLRVRGSLLLGTGEPNAAETQFRDSIAVAVRQGARSWQLRAATSLARLLAGRGEMAEAKSLLTAARAPFTEGFTSRDVLRADALLNELGSPKA